MVIAITALTFVALCIDADLRFRRIPNVLSGLGMLFGVALNVLYFGRSGLIDSMTGLTVSTIFLLVPFALGGIGGGDVKMMGAVGALLGPAAALRALLLGVAVGGLVMVAHLVRRGRLQRTLVNVHAMAAESVLGRSLAPLTMSAARAGAITLPYSIPLGLGTAVVLLTSGRLAAW